MKKLLKYFKHYKVETILAPLFKLLEAFLDLLIPLIVKDIIDIGIKNEDTTYIIYRVILMVGIGIIGLLFSVCGQYFAAKASTMFSVSIRKDLFDKIQNLSFTQIDDLGTSQMITIMTSDVNQMQSGINLTLRLFLRSPFIVFGSAVLATIISPKLSLVFWIVIPVLLLIIFGIMLYTIPLYKKSQERLDTVLEKTRENLTGVRVVRAFGVEENEKEDFISETTNLNKSQNKAGRVSSLLNPLTYAIINIAIIILINMGMVEVDNGALTQGEVIALYNYMSQILVELIKFANLIITITKSLASSKRVQSVFDINSNTNSIVSNDNNSINDIFISFSHVFMRYNNASEDSLMDINFNVNKGETIGIIGGTGSGKTTLVNLIPRFYEVTKGAILIDGKDIRTYDLDNLREKIGIVMQKSVLFKGTIKDNILWGKKNATDEEIIEALTNAQALDIIKNKSKGIYEEVEQGGKNFSGGQRQRLCIARTLVAKPEIIIFDDSSSALDYATSAKLRKALANLDYKPTIFIVSQRTTSVKNANKIVVLDDGVMTGFDTHDNLLKSNTVYQENYALNSQKEVK